MARAAESVGFDSLWLGDHLLYDLPSGARGPWEVWTSLAALAAVTERVELGPLVASTGFHAPAMLAKQAATVDAISGGRLILGLGAGWNEREYRAFGFPFDRRVARFAESFTIVRTLLRDGRIDFAGEFYTLEDCVLDPPPSRPGGPPLLLGSIGTRMLAIGSPTSTRGTSGGPTTGTLPRGSPRCASGWTRRRNRPGAGRARSPRPPPSTSGCQGIRAGDGRLPRRRSGPGGRAPRRTSPGTSRRWRPPAPPTSSSPSIRSRWRRSRRSARSSPSSIDPRLR